VTALAIQIDDPAWTAALPAAPALVRQAAKAAMTGHDGEIAILLTGDRAVQELNRRFLGKDRPTNVLAFPDAGAGRLGDIALAFGVCAGEAAEQAKPLADHLRHLVVHGVLHLLGYDHQGEDDASRMEALERRLLALMSIADPYQARADVRG
jgi:probable rRNA maturation factor